MSRFQTELVELSQGEAFVQSDGVLAIFLEPTSVLRVRTVEDDEETSENFDERVDWPFGSA